MSEAAARCSATSKQSGEPCRQPVIPGGSVCHYHGGGAPQVKAAAQRRLAEDRARRRLDEVDVASIDNPLEAFAQLVAEAVALKDALASQVAALEDLRSANNRWGTEQVRAEMAAYERAMDRAGKLLEQWVRLGLDERLVASRERIESLMIGYLTLAWMQGAEMAGLPPATLARLHVLMADQLRQLEGLDDAELSALIEAWHRRRDQLPKVAAAELPAGFVDDNPDLRQYLDVEAAQVEA